MDIKETYKVYNTILEMLHDRGYKIDKIRDVSYDEFMIMYEENNYDILDDEKKINVVFFKETKTFAKKDLESITQHSKLEYGEDIKIIIILKEKTKLISKELSNDLYKNVQLFLFKDLIFNKTKHSIVPKHILLSDDEAKSILNKYACTKNQLPKILSTDPIAQYYDMKPGNIVKIIRQSTASGDYISYRLVR